MQVRDELTKDGIGATVTQVAEDAKAYAAAQVDLYRTIARVRIRAGKIGIVLGVVAAILAIAAFGALLVGLILSLATLIGPLGATGVVVVVTLLIAGVLGRMAGQRLAAAFGGSE